ncbi:MAG: glycosyltransferase family 1 protein [Nitrospirota bacterium]
MKIGINATFLNEKPTGASVLTKEVSRIISKLNKEMLFFSPMAYNDIPSECIYKVSKAMRGSPGLSNSLYRFFYINIILPVVCKLKRVDVLYCPILEFPFIPLVPLVVHVHDLHYIYFSSEFGLAAPRLKLSLKVIGHIAKRVVVSSKFVKKELIGSTAVKETMVDIVPLAFNNSMFRPMPIELKEDFLRKYDLKGNYILFVGSLFPYKNLKALIEAFLKIKDQIPHSLVVVGRKEFSAEPIVSNGRIFYMDYVPVEDLPLFYSYADVFVYPSLREGFGIPPLEAMACGTPVVCSSGGSIPEVVGDAGVYFDPLDSGVLPQLILKIINNNGLRNELKEKGFKQVKKFSWDRTAEDILKSCEKVVKEKG